MKNLEPNEYMAPAAGLDCLCHRPPPIPRAKSAQRPAMMLHMGQQNESDIFQIPDGLDGGMTFDRYREIEEAEAEGTPLKLSADERAEYEETRDSLKGSFGQLRDALNGNFKSMSERLSAISSGTPSGHPAVNVESMREKAITSFAQQTRRVAADSGISQDTLDSIAAAKRLEHEREERNSGNIEVTAQVMQDMLAVMSEQAAEAAARDAEAKSAARKNFWLALGSLIFAALAVIAPFVIEAIKGWD